MPRSRRIPTSLVLLAAVSVLGGCAHTKAQEAEASLLEERESEAAQVRRENSALRAKVQNLEERVRLLEQGESMAYADDGEWSSPDAGDPGDDWSEPTGDGPRELPVVKLEPRNGGKISARPAEEPTQEPPTRVLRQTGSISLSPMPNSGSPEYADVEYEEEAYEEPSSAGTTSYRLVGSKLVQATKNKPQISTGKKDRASGVVSDYDSAMETYRDGRYADAEAAFQSIVKDHPNHEYADNALYWQGEAAYDQAHYADALAAFTAVVERYGGGGKAPDALLKIGLCYGRLGDDANAKDVLTQLIAAYPRSDASKIAKRKLDELSQ